MEKKMRTEFRVGDKVECLIRGAGFVRSVSDLKVYPLVARMTDGNSWVYVEGGKPSHASPRTLFFAVDREEGYGKTSIVCTTAIEDQPVLTEVTLEEIASKFNVPVEGLRIKK